jgi:hypothetical protein
MISTDKDNVIADWHKWRNHLTTAPPLNNILNDTVVKKYDMHF